MAVKIEPRAVGVFYSFEPAFLDSRGKLAKYLFDVLEDKTADLHTFYGSRGAPLMPDEIMLTSAARKCTMNMSPVRLTIGSDKLTFDELGELTKRVRDGLEALFHDVQIEKIASIAQATAKLPADKTDLDIRVLGARFPGSTETQVTASSGDFMRVVSFATPTAGTLGVTIDLQKVKTPRWSDIADIHALTKTELEQLVAELGLA